VGVEPGICPSCAFSEKAAATFSSENATKRRVRALFRRNQHGVLGCLTLAMTACPWRKAEQAQEKEITSRIGEGGKSALRDLLLKFSG
jgi:hypothetical protein